MEKSYKINKMVHSAYDSIQLVNNSPAKIDAIESYGDKLLLACSDGALKICYPESSAGETQSPTSEFHLNALELKKELYVLERTLDGFSKKPMLAMEVLKSRELLLSLSKAIAFRWLPNLETLSVITKAKGANAYSWDERRGFLFYARQKRVCIFRHDGGQGFVEVKEFGVPDTVKSMLWCGEDICVGIRREYMILNATNGSLSEVFPSVRIALPLVVSLLSGKLLLGKDNIGVFVDQNGNLLQGGRICWSEAPAAVTIENPYALGLLPRHIEIWSLRSPYPLIQTVVLRSVHHLLHSNHVIIVAVENSVYGLEVLGYHWKGSSAMSDDMESSPSLHVLDSEERADLESKKMSHNTLMALIKFLQRKRYSIIEKATAEGTEETVSDAIGNDFVVYGTSCSKKAGKNLLPFLGPLLRKSSEAYRTFSVIKSLRESENLQVKD